MPLPRVGLYKAAMLFFEPLFLFLFFPLFYLMYLVSERRLRLRFAVVLGGSVLFYAWIQPTFVPIVFAWPWRTI